MSVLVVVESLFGNTREVAEEVAIGLREEHPGLVVTVVAAGEAPQTVPSGVRLLVVGGPTHAFSMTRDTTRADAVKHGADEDRAGTGIREWITSLTAREGVEVVTFDTRVKVPGLPGSAAKSAAKALRKRGFEQVDRGRTFWVHGKEGPLENEQLVGAREWGSELAARVTSTAEPGSGGYSPPS